MHQNHQTRNAKPLLKLLFGIPIARPRALAAVELSMVASLTPAAVHAQEYQWCLSRDRAISIASIRHRSNVSGQHQASAAALRIRGCCSRTSRAIPFLGVVEPDVSDLT